MRFVVGLSHRLNRARISSHGCFPSTNVLGARLRRPERVLDTPISEAFGLNSRKNVQSCLSSHWCVAAGRSISVCTMGTAGDSMNLAVLKTREREFDRRGDVFHAGRERLGEAPDATRPVTNCRRSKVIRFPRETRIAVCGLCWRFLSLTEGPEINHFTILFG